MDVSPYLEHYLKESAKEEKEIDRLFFKLNRKVREIAARLGSKYNLKKIYLFGSLTDRDTFHLKSDIDIAVTGLNAEDFLDLCGDLEKQLEYSFDLVNLDTVEHRLYEQIMKEGEIIYEG